MVKISNFDQFTGAKISILMKFLNWSKFDFGKSKSFNFQRPIINFWKIDYNMVQFEFHILWKQQIFVSDIVYLSKFWFQAL